LRHRVRAGRPVEDAEIGEHAGFGAPVDENEFGKTASDVGARKYIRGHILCHQYARKFIDFVRDKVCGRCSVPITGVMVFPLFFLSKPPLITSRPELFP
jgi:hypothetical protein